MVESRGQGLSEFHDANKETYRKQIQDMGPIILRFVFRKFLHLVNNGTISPEDIAQQAITQAIKNADKLSENSNIRAWMFTITENLILDQLRRQNLIDKNINNVTNELYEAQNPDTDPMFHDPIQRKHLQIALSKLVPEQQDVIRLRLEDIPDNEIAVRLGISINTVRTRFFRAIIELKKLLTAEGVDSDTKDTE